MTYETEVWPYVPAANIGPKRTKIVQLGVVHTAQAREALTGAEDLARYFQHPDYISSTHISVDSDSIVQSVKDSFIAWAAPPVNDRAIQMELVCYMEQTKAQWLDRYSLLCLCLAADAAAQYSLKYDLPAIHLSNAELKAGKKGWVGHNQVSEVYHESNHSDPGPNFPWPRFMLMMQAFIAERK
jgi:N-acetyl-anhydromuramyl-L-alanine amidase AmpD